jgi:hypothetical protein
MNESKALFLPGLECRALIGERDLPINGERKMGDSENLIDSTDVRVSTLVIINKKKSIER